MDCGAPRFEGPLAEKIYNHLMGWNLQRTVNNLSRKEKREKRLKEFSDNLKKNKPL